MPTDLHLFTHEFAPFRGGIASYCHEWASAASQQIPSVTVHAPSDARAPIERPTYCLVTHPYSRSHGWLNLFRSRRALQTCLQAAPQATYLLAEPGSILSYGLLAKQLPTAELYICLHGSEVLRWRSPSLARHWALASMRAAKKILTVSEPIADLCRQSFPQFADKVQAVNNALPDATRTDCLRAQSAESAAKHSTPSIERNPTLHLLSVGRIHPRKGFHHVLEALSRLNPDKRARIHYTIAGATGKHRAYLTKLKNTAAHHGIQLELQLDCTPEALHACYQKAEVFALTSIRYRNSIEGFGLVYLEAAAHGLPAIAYDHGGVRAAIRDGETGWLIPAGDTQRLASKIAELTDQPARVRRMGQEAYKQALQRTWSDVVTESLSQLP